MSYTHYTNTGPKAFIAAARAIAQGAQPPPGLPAPQKEAKEYQKLMVDEMTKAEPETPRLLAKRDELVQRYRALQNPVSEG